MNAQPTSAPEDGPAARAIGPEVEPEASPGPPEGTTASSVETAAEETLTESDETTPQASRPRPAWWKRAWTVFGALIGIVGAVTGVIGILPIVFRDATDAESLVIDVEPADAELAPVFAVPLSADWTTLPRSPGTCSSEQGDWLEAHGVRLPERYTVHVTNTAKEGATMSLSQFRGEGTAEEAPPQNIAVVCARTASTEPHMRVALLNPATGRIAVYLQPAPFLVDNPLVVNIRPGESGDFGLLIRSSSDFDGRIVFRVAIAGDSDVRVLPIGDGLSAPGIVSQRLIVADGWLACADADAKCDPLAVIAESLAAAPND